MSLHRLTQIVMGVPNVSETVDYYVDFGLSPHPCGEENGSAERDRTRSLATVDGGEQLKISRSDRRRLLQLGVGVDDPDDLDRAAAGLQAIGITVERSATRVRAFEPGTEVWVVVEIADRIRQDRTPSPAYNTPGVDARTNQRAAGILRETPVRPRRLGHVVLGSTDQDRSQRFFAEGLGFKTSDTVPGLASFLRCSSDHHNVLVQQSPLAYLHHTSWQVDDLDDIGRGATAMLEKDPGRHVWGLGRHHIGSNFFWYLKDPAGNFSEYYSDMDCIVDDAVWAPQVWGEARSLYSWGPPPPPSFLHPEDLAAHMTGTHCTT
ncbi:VOC family protein [Dactylosporangium sp. CA-233914]|uniref:VOC family protein n=1 Tax=Dactylosporangium sp. CA-233914 TaxID=3239934 RepID=UPI003D8CBC29